MKKGYRIKSLRSNINILELSKKSSWNFFYFNVSKNKISEKLIKVKNKINLQVLGMDLK